MSKCTSQKKKEKMSAIDVIYTCLESYNVPEFIKPI